MTKGKGKALVTPMVAVDSIPWLTNFFGSDTKSHKLLVEEVLHTNALLFNLGADVAENTKLVGT